MSLVEASALYNLLAPSTYEGVVRQLEWQGPRDMGRILAPVAMGGAVVADFAIGTGPLSGAFRRAGARRIIGVDASKRYLDYCVAAGRADEVHLSDLSRNSTAIDNAAIDVTTCSGLFSYFTNPEMLVWELTRVTRPGGHIAVNFHPSVFGMRGETLPATVAGDGARVRVEHHDAGIIESLFSDCRAELRDEIHTKSGIIRMETGYSVPLRTQLYRLRGA